MKEQYIEAEMDIIALDCDDVIATSSAILDPSVPSDDWV